MARLANQIVCVCAYLRNFQPALVPIASTTVDVDTLSTDSDVEDYFNGLSDDESDCTVYMHVD